MIRIHLFIRVTFFFLLLLFSSEGKSQLVVPRIEWTDLPMFGEKRPDIKTGCLIVPENRSSGQRVHSIKLPFVIIKSRSATPQPDPVLFITGGPGGSTIVYTGMFHQSPLLDDRDIILLEQRGNRFAKPSLLGSELDSALRSGWGTQLNGDPDPKAITQTLATIIQSYNKDGIDLTCYTTKESAADISDLRLLLGVKTWNLYGVSYSTKLMLTVLRDHPDGVRSVILDSVLPLEANCDEETPANIIESLEQLFTLCQQDERLCILFPDLRKRFFHLLAEANSHPVEISLKDPFNGKPFSVSFNGVGIMNCIYVGLEDGSVIQSLPLIIDAACKGKFNRLEPLAINYLASTQGTAWGMRISVWCNEEFPFERIDKILKPTGMPSELEHFIQPQVPLETMQMWPHGKPDAQENTHVSSNVPVLIASGELDPDTPTKWALQTASFLPNAQLIIFAGYTHCPLNTHPEAARIMHDFLASPFLAPDPGKTSVRPAFFLSWEEKK